jgi:hypothetical protein
MIRVYKRDRSIERFDVWKLTGAMWRSMQDTSASFVHARKLAEAIAMHIERCSENGNCVSSSAVFEMVLKAFRCVGLERAAETAETYRSWRSMLRRQLRIRYEGGALTYWDKGWLCEFASRSWCVSRSVARMVAGKVELIYLLNPHRVVARDAVIEELNRAMSEYGLADAVPAVRE